MENIFLENIKQKVSLWREDSYVGVYPETRNILLKIKQENFLHEPQREALETYIYLKEILNNKSVPELVFATAQKEEVFLKELGFSSEIVSVFNSLPKENQVELLQQKIIQLGLTDYGYPNYVLALTMGSGKTILMGVLVMYEFILSFKHPDDKRFAKNALVFGPADTGIVEVLKEIKTFDYSKVLPKEYDDIVLNVKYWYLEKPETPLNPLGNYNVIVSNSSKIILKDWKETHKGNRLFELRKQSANKRLLAIQGLENLTVFVDEAHHSYGEKLTEALNQSRKTIKHLAENTSVVSVVNLTGTPYVKNVMLPDTVYTFGLQQGMEKGILKLVQVTNHGKTKDVQSSEFVNTVIDTFVRDYGETRLEGRLPKIAFYTTDITMLEELEQNIDTALRKHKIPVSKKLVWHSTYTGEKKKDADFEFNRLDTPQSEKQFILLVNKGTEGWNCKSLVAVALYKNSTSNNFVLQASCRCLRRIGDNSVKARVFLSDENYKVLNDELEKNFNTSISKLSDGRQVEIQIDLVVNKRTKVKIKRNMTDIVASSMSGPENIMLSFVKFSAGREPQLIQEREVVLVDGKAVYRDPKTIQSEDKETYRKQFGYYDVISIIQQKTHFSFTEINKVFIANNISRNQIIEEVEKNYLIIHSLADQILEQAVKYERKVTEIEQEVELTKSFPYKITVKKDKDETDEIAFSKSLLVYREQEENEGRTSRLGFHINPYNFDSQDELEMFRYLRRNLEDGEEVNDVYFTGGVHTEKHNEFFFEYWDASERRVSKYFPDFLIETSFGRYLVLEVKGDNEEHAYNSDKIRYIDGKIKQDEIVSIPYAKELGFQEFQKLNNNFEYHIIFNGKVLSHQQKTIEYVSSLKK